MSREARSRWHRAGRRGAVAVEFALVMVIGFLPLLFAIIDWSLYFFQATLVQTELWNAARLGVSYDHTADGVCPTDRAEDALADALTAWGIGGATITSVASGETYYGAEPPQQLEQLTLTVVIPFSPILGLAPTPDNLGGSVTVPFEIQVGC